MMNGTDGVTIQMPCAPGPMAEGDAPKLVHSSLVTALASEKPYYIEGGLIPHLTKKGYFWKSTPPAIRLSLLQHRRHIDPAGAVILQQMEELDCGWISPLPRKFQYDGVTGMHLSLGPDCTLKNVQYWVKQDGTTAKAASPAMPPISLGTSVHGLTIWVISLMKQRQMSYPLVSSMMRLALNSTQVMSFPPMSWSLLKSAIMYSSEAQGTWCSLRLDT